MPGDTWKIKPRLDSWKWGCKSASFSLRWATNSLPPCAHQSRVVSARANSKVLHPAGPASKLRALVAQVCPTPWDPMGPPGSSVYGILRQEYWSRWPCPPPGDLLDPGIEPASLMSPALTGGFFTTRATSNLPWDKTKTLSKGYFRLLCIKLNKHIYKVLKQCQVTAQMQQTSLTSRDFVWFIVIKYGRVC